MRADPDLLDRRAARSGWSRARQDAAIVVWPSFLVAAVGTMFFFAAFDPAAIGAGTALEDLLQNRSADYTIGFFCFWVLCAAASALTLYLARTQRRAGAPPAPGARP